VLSPDETNKVPVPPANQLKLHHAFAVVASDYLKRHNVLRLTLSDRSQFLFQSSDTREMHSWIDMINWNAARFSSQALEAPCSSTGRFQRPLLPSCVTRMSRREQVETHKAAAAHWEKELDNLV
jgi:PH/SEC7 domain-containing protein